MKLLSAILLLALMPAGLLAQTFKPAIPVTHVIRCNSSELAKNIMGAFETGQAEGEAALKKAYASRNSFGLVSCNPVSATPLFVASAQILDRYEQVPPAPLTVITHFLLEVSASAFPNGPFTDHTLIAREGTIDLLFGEAH